jgi:hypothetical protein
LARSPGCRFLHDWRVSPKLVKAQERMAERMYDDASSGL